MEHQASRRDLLLTSLMAAFPFGVLEANASPLNPKQTVIEPPDALQWKSQPNFPPNSVGNCTLTGDTAAAGLYYTLVRWYPGYTTLPTRGFGMAMSSSRRVPPRRLSLHAFMTILPATRSTWRIRFRFPLSDLAL